MAYHDSDAKNNGSGSLNPADGTYLNEFRKNEGVDTSYTKFRDEIDNNPYNMAEPAKDQLYVGWTEPGEWFNMTVLVKLPELIPSASCTPRIAEARSVSTWMAPC